MSLDKSSQAISLLEKAEELYQLHINEGLEEKEKLISEAKQYSSDLKNQVEKELEEKQKKIDEVLENLENEKFKLEEEIKKLQNFEITYKNNLLKEIEGFKEFLEKSE